MKKIFAIMSLVLCCVCSRADTNTVDLTEIEILLSDVNSNLQDIQGQIGTLPGTVTLMYLVNQTWSLVNVINSIIRNPDNSRFNGNAYQQIRDLFRETTNSLFTVNTTLSSIAGNIQDIAGDTPNIEYQLEQCRSLLEEVCYNYLSSIIYYLQDISQKVAYLPAIEGYQSALSVIVSNINEHILAGINVSIPNTINVDVRNFPNFNPEWDYLSKTFQWSGWNHDNTWQEFSSPNSQDNTLQGASPMPVPATTTLAEYLDKLYVGINNSGRILNDSIIHACYLLEGSNTVSQAEQEEVSDSVSDSVDNADTTMEQISSSIPTPSLSVDTSYISRGISFWDQIGNIQKPPYIVLTTSPSDGDLISVPEIHIEVKLSEYPALDKGLEFARSVFTWLWWVLSVFFLLWLFRRAMVLYSMVMSLLGPQPAQTTAVDVV